MKLKLLTYIASFFLLTAAGNAQTPCSALGQTPSSAFPVCGNTTFTQTTVGLCGSINLIVPCFDGAQYQDRNPYWYKFKCYTAGQLGFVITPIILTDDYDWQLFDVTGRNPADVFTDASLFVACNWSGLGGATGASAAGSNLSECAGTAFPLFSRMPFLIQDHEYLLMVSHFTPTQTGYQLTFTGGTANITDPLPPLSSSVTANCDGTRITLHYNKKLKCSSLSASGSEFTISPSGTVVSATAPGCSTGFDFDSLTLTLSGPLLPGNYTVSAVNGADGNTLFDHCNTPVVTGDNQGFTIGVPPPLPMGTIGAVNCAPSSIVLNFTDSINCNSIAANGSDFLITGPSPVSIISATATCNGNGKTNSISIQLATPINISGNYTLQITTGSDGNTLTGPCQRQVIPGDNRPFTIPVVPPSTMTTIPAVGCSPATIRVNLSAPVQCSSVASNGSDFIITGGTSPVTISSATGTCVNGLTNSIDVQLSSPIVTGGNYLLQLVTGNDGNTLLSDCYRLTPTGSSLPFVTSDTVSARFTYQVQSTCTTSDISFSNPGGNGINSWNWTINGNPAGVLPAFTQTFPGTSQQTVQLTVSNGVCSDTRSETIILNNKVVADFEMPDMICPEDSAVFTNLSTGPVDNWQWSFGNGQFSQVQSPVSQRYPLTGREAFYNITLTASNNNGCQDTKTKTLKVLGTCRIEVPSGFTPNNDGLNDYLYPLNAFKVINLEFKVYNRWGQLIFETKEWTKRWDGKFKGVEQASGIYAWTLSYKDKDTGEQFSSKGTTMLVR
jgi:gliding motility-associated-like protein